MMIMICVLRGIKLILLIYSFDDSDFPEALNDIKLMDLCGKNKWPLILFQNVFQAK